MLIYLIISSCYKFNSGRNASGDLVPDRLCTKSGQLKRPNNGDVCRPSRNDPETFSTSAGLHIIVHNKSTEVFFPDGFDVGTGTQANIAISRTFTSLLEKSYSECSRNIESNPSVCTKALLDSNYR